MIRIGILGDIGSGKSFVAQNFGYPIFNADLEVSKLYKKNRKVFIKLKKILPKYFKKFPVSKSDVSKAILDNNKNLNKIVKIVHVEVRKKIIILDIPLLLKNKINRKKDILIFVQSKREQVFRRLKKRENFNNKIFDNFKKIQLPLDYKKKKADFIFKNNFRKKLLF